MEHTALPATRGARLGILALLALVMLATRINHFGAVPDASWALFFIAGFYLRGWGRIAFPLLMALAVAIDYVVVTGQGIPFWSHYCVSTAYLFLLPSYAAPWLGGAWLRRRYDGTGLREAGLLAGSSLVAASACFLVSNGSFYWISANVPRRTFGGWLQNMGDWYLSYLGTTLVYVAIAAVLHVLAVQALRAVSGGAGAPARG